MNSSSLDLGLSAPIIQAPMAGVQNPRLAAAVCNAGGLGSLPAAMLSASDLQAQLSSLKQATDKPFNVNFFCHAVPTPDDAREAAWREALKPSYLALGLDAQRIASGPGRVPFNHEAADVLEAFRPAVVSFHFGLPAADLVERVKSWGSRIFSSATTVDEALWLQAHGADAIIAQGLEAGGHRGMFLTDDLSTQMGTFALLPQIVQAVSIPVVAAGGIASAAGVRAAKALGAGDGFIEFLQDQGGLPHGARVADDGADQVGVHHVLQRTAVFLSLRRRAGQHQHRCPRHMGVGDAGHGIGDAGAGSN